MLGEHPSADKERMAAAATAVVAASMAFRLLVALLARYMEAGGR